MKNIATIKLKIPTTNKIIATIRQYSKALQFCINYAWKNKIRNNVRLHHKVYYKIRKTYKLPSQLAICCISQAVQICKKIRTKPIIKRRFIRYNPPRSFSYKRNTLSILTLKGRQKFNIPLPEFAKQYANWNIIESHLIIDRKQRCFFCLSVSKDITINTHNKAVLGIDVGINNVAVTSNKQFFNARQIKLKKLKFRRLKAKLQAKGTRSAKRLLRKLSGREKRFMAYWNHVISKQIVDNCKAGTIVLENLKGIRKQRKGRRFNFWLHSWSFYQLQGFICYKAARKGIKVIKVSPYHTSKTCSHCGNLGSRSKSFFSCSHCGYSLNADLNGAINIASKQHSMSDVVSADVNQPNVADDDGKTSTSLDGLSLSPATCLTL